MIHRARPLPPSRAKALFPILLLILVAVLIWCYRSVYVPESEWEDTLPVIDTPAERFWF